MAATLEKHFDTVKDWFLQQHGWGNARQQPLPADFSTRRYIRLHGPHNALLMAMPGDAGLQAFVTMQQALQHCTMRVPALYAVDIAAGLALIEDLGDASLDRCLGQGKDAGFYQLAVDALIHLHRQQPPAMLPLPHFNADLFTDQVCLFLECYGALVLQKPFSAEACRAFHSLWQGLLQPIAQLPQTVLLRDYHPGNIMYLAQERGHHCAGLIDFQDGGTGPCLYDVVSLLEDARRDVDPALSQTMQAYYRSAVGWQDKALFDAAYAVLGAQRHLRILAILARRWVKQGVDCGAYFRRTWRLLLAHQSQPELAPLYAWLEAQVPPRWRGDWRV